MPADLVARTALAGAADTHWWTFTAPTAGTYEVRLGDLPSAYRLAVSHPGGSTSTGSSSTQDRVRTMQLAAGARVHIAISVGYGTPTPDRAYRLSVTPPAVAAGSTWFARTVHGL
jgi:hypothetical protein